MRCIVLGFIVGLAALMAGLQSGSAQDGGYNNRWCTDGGGVDEGSHLECSYYTLQQCEESARGRGQHCTQNPDIAWRARGTTSSQRRSGRQRNRNGEYQGD